MSLATCSREHSPLRQQQHQQQPPAQLCASAGDELAELSPSLSPLRICGGTKETPRCPVSLSLTPKGPPLSSTPSTALPHAGDDDVASCCTEETHFQRISLEGRFPWLQTFSKNN